MLCTMPRLIAAWSTVLLLLVAACEIQQLAVQGDVEVGNHLEIGDLTSQTEQAVSAAAAKLSNGENQHGWWRLAKADWHDSAFLRFFVEGPPHSAEMESSAKWSGQYSAGADTWNAAQIVNVASSHNIDLIRALQQVSTATYRMNKSIEGTGSIRASMWTLLFRCIGIASCNEGYFVPLIFVPRSSSHTEKEQQQQQRDDDDQYTNSIHVRSLWLHLSTNLLVNSIPSSIVMAQLRAMPVSMADVDDDPELSIMVNVYDSISECPPAAAVLDYRSLLDASYGLLPGVACINFGTSAASTSSDQPFKLLVSRVLPFDNSTEPRDVHLTSLEQFFSAIHVKTGQWTHLPFEECSEEGLLIAEIRQNSQNPASLQLCYQKICVAVSNANWSVDGVQHLRILYSIAIQSKASTYINGSTGTCQMGNTSTELCNATVDVVDIESTYSVYPRRLLSLASNWTSTKGVDTSEFSQAPHMNAATRMCFRTPSPQFPFFLSDTIETDFLRAIQIQARAYLNSLIAEHNIAFTMIKGPPTEILSFLALIVSTAISVILAIVGPFPNFLLRIICRKWPLHLDSQRSRVRKVVNVLFEMICSVLLSNCSFLPVLYVAWSDRSRETSFDTWDLASNDQFIYDSSGTSEIQLRVVYLISATSKYHSTFLFWSTLVVCITCIIAGVCSVWRSMEVFARYAVLQEYDSIQAFNGPFKKLAADRRTSLVIRALKAIDMTEAEYLDMKSKVMNFVRRQQPALRRKALTGTVNFRAATRGRLSRLASGKSWKTHASLKCIGIRCT